MHSRLVQLIKRKKSLEFRPTINRVLIKKIRTVSVDVIRECRLWFGIPDIKVLVVKRKKIPNEIC